MAAKNALKLALRLIPVVVLAFSGLLVSATSAGASSQPNWNSGHPYYCSGGNIPSGSYSSIVVTGVCYMPSGTVNVWGNLSIAPGALLDAVTPGDPLPPATPVVPATVLVGGNVFVGTGAALILGCSPNILCTNPPGITYDRINGSVTAFGAWGSCCTRLPSAATSPSTEVEVEPTATPVRPSLPVPRLPHRGPTMHHWTTHRSTATSRMSPSAAT
jgi:hypothetical protein